MQHVQMHFSVYQLYLQSLSPMVGPKLGSNNLSLVSSEKAPVEILHFQLKRAQRMRARERNLATLSAAQNEGNFPLRKAK